MENNTGLDPNTAPVNEELDWNSDISNDGQDYVILPEGEYVFQVVDLDQYIIAHSYAASFQSHRRSSSK